MAIFIIVIAIIAVLALIGVPLATFVFIGIFTSVNKTTETGKAHKLLVFLFCLLLAIIVNIILFFVLIWFIDRNMTESTVT